MPTITNGYATLDEVKREAAIESLDIVDDEVLARCIEDASRAVDTYAGRQFFAASASRAVDAPVDGSRSLYLTEDWLTVTSATNGDGSLIAGSALELVPRSVLGTNVVRLKNAAGQGWRWTNDGDWLGAITLTGSVGYVDRASTDPRAVTVVRNTTRATLIVAMAMYRKRMGLGGEAVTVTAAGVVLSPVGFPRDAAQLLDGYRVMP